MRPLPAAALAVVISACGSAPVVHEASVSRPVTVAPPPSTTTPPTPPPTTTTSTSAPPRPTPTTVSRSAPMGVSYYATCYDLRGRTADGDLAGPESVAVDPAEIPLGTRVWIEGVGERTADDTGGAVRGLHVDVWEPSCAGWANRERVVRVI